MVEIVIITNNKEIKETGSRPSKEMELLWVNLFSLRNIIVESIKDVL
jgi:hypothetical protein